MAEVFAFSADINQLYCEKTEETEVLDSEDVEFANSNDAEDDQPQLASADTRVIHCGQTAGSYKQFRVSCGMSLEELKSFMYEQTGVPQEHQEFLTSARDLGQGMRFALRSLNPEDCKDLYMERYLRVQYYETSRFPPFQKEDQSSFYILETASIKSVKKKILEQKGLWDFIEDRIKRMPDGKTPAGKVITDETKVHELTSGDEHVFSHYRDYRFVLIVESPEGQVLSETSWCK